MLKRLHLRNFTVFENADFEFGKGLNVIVGTNGTGKSHVLKAGYVLLHNLLQRLRDGPVSQEVLEDYSQKAFLREKLINVFQPEPSDDVELIRHFMSVPEASVALTADYPIGQFANSVTFSPKKSKTTYTIPSYNEGVNLAHPIFIPAKEVLSLSWLLSVYEYRRVRVDETYPDILRLLAVPALREVPSTVSVLILRLRQIINGDVEEAFGRYYLSSPGQPRMEINLVAEGLRKFATLYKLLANGTLTPDTTLFWDEPEANLNPALLKDMAAVLAELARAGFQIILATHSLFLMKELHIIAQREPMPIRYFGLSTENGGPTQVAAADKLTALPNLVALDVEMTQSDVFLDVLNREDAGV